MTATKEEYWF